MKLVIRAIASAGMRPDSHHVDERPLTRMRGLEAPSGSPPSPHGRQGPLGALVGSVA